MATRTSFPLQGEGDGNSGRKASVVTFQPSPGTAQANQRRISEESGRALEVLGHAVEYLADEYALNSEEMGVLESGDPRVEAIQLLMSLNRQVYYACPIAEPPLRRLAGWLLGGAPARGRERTAL